MCSSLNDIKPLEELDVSNGNNFSYMFCWCLSLNDIKPSEEWNVSNEINFKGMFRLCKLKDYKPLEK